MRCIGGTLSSYYLKGTSTDAMVWNTRLKISSTKAPNKPVKYNLLDDAMVEIPKIEFKHPPPREMRFRSNTNIF